MEKKFHKMSPELKAEVDAILNKDLDPVYKELLYKISDHLAESDYAPWLVAYRSTPDECRVALEAPDTDFTPDLGEFGVSDAFIERVNKKYGFEREFIVESLKKAMLYCDLIWETDNGYKHCGRGLWIDGQMGLTITETLGTAYYKVLHIMEDQESILVDEERFRQRIKDGIHTSVARIVPRYDSVKDIEGLMPAENMKEIIASKKTFALSPCPCRLRCPESDVDWDLNVCLGSDNYAELIIRMDKGVRMTPDEAFEHIQAAGLKVPLVHIYGFKMDLVNSSQVHCNCHPEACTVARHTMMTGGKHKLWELYQKSRFRAVIDPEKCVDCGICYKKRCAFEAINIRYNRKLSRELPEVYDVTCMGCGCCVETCPKGAIKMELVDPPEALLGYNFDEYGDPVFIKPEDAKQSKSVLGAP